MQIEINFKGFAIRMPKHENRKSKNTSKYRGFETNFKWRIEAKFYVLAEISFETRPKTANA